MNENTNATQTLGSPARPLLLIFTRTPLHVGAGESVGAIDQPIQRERPTGFPIIPGSSTKGSIRAAALDVWGEERTKKFFGKEDDKGKVAFGDARIFAFPVRSARGAFAFITCPLVLQRLQREHSGFAPFTIPDEPEEMQCLAGTKVTLGKPGEEAVVLEEYRFDRPDVFPLNWQQALLGLMLDDPVWQAGAGRFVLLSNGDFGHFVRTACEVNQHVSIDPKTGTQKGKFLFNLEAVPAECAFFAPLTPAARATEEMKTEFASLLSARSIHQFGGDSTTGLGFCTLQLLGHL